MKKTGSFITDKQARIILRGIDIAFCCTLLVLPAAWFLNPFELTLGGIRLLRASWGYKTILAPFMLLMVRILFARYIRHQTGDPATPLIGVIAKKMMLGVLPVFLMLLGGEAMLARIDFKLLSSPLVITGDDRRATDDSNGILGDPVLRWKYKPGGSFRGRPVNRLGFLDREVEEIKPAGMKRIICMGCSCTAQGPRSYSEILHEKLQNAPPTTNRWEAFNMGVHGYSSVLGLRLFQKRGKQLGADIVTLYFGWNDHWQSGYWPDSHGIPLQVKPSRFAAAMQRLLQRKVIQFAVYCAARTPMPVSIRGKVVLNDSQKFGNCLRVPQQEYRATLQTFIAEIQSIGAIPLIITAPRAATLTPLLVAHGQATSVTEAIQLHDEYVAMARDIARVANVPLLDLAKEAPLAVHLRYLGDDGIHLTLDGRQWVADRIHAMVSNLLAIPATIPTSF